MAVFFFYTEDFLPCGVQAGVEVFFKPTIWPQGACQPDRTAKNEVMKNHWNSQNTEHVEPEHIETAHMEAEHAEAEHID